MDAVDGALPVVSQEVVAVAAVDLEPEVVVVVSQGEVAVVAVHSVAVDSAPEVEVLVVVVASQEVAAAAVAASAHLEVVVVSAVVVDKSTTRIQHPSLDDQRRCVSFIQGSCGHEKTKAFRKTFVAIASLFGSKYQAKLTKPSCPADRLHVISTQRPCTGLIDTEGFPSDPV